MKTETITLSAPNGLHARPAGELVKIVKNFAPDTKITLSSAGKSANAASMISILALGLKNGSAVEIAADGPAEAEALEAVRTLLIGITQ